jgi:nucleoside-diphosphate-sugar epimerase
LFHYGNFSLIFVKKTTRSVITVYEPIIQSTAETSDGYIINLFSAIKNDEPVTIYEDGNQTRDLTFITNIIEANLLAAQYPEPGNVIIKLPRGSVNGDNSSFTILNDDIIPFDIYYKEDRIPQTL